MPCHAKKLVENRDEDWAEKQLEYEKFGPFVTHVWLYHYKEGWKIYSARPVRKGIKWIKPMTLAPEEREHFIVCTRRINSWIAVLFMIGASLFALPGFLPSAISSYFNVIYFCGSIFFTSAAYLQFVESINKDITNPKLFITQRCHWLRFGWRPQNLGYLSALIQFVGTVLFNVNCLAALLPSLTPMQENVSIWVPGFLGSICFLSSAAFAWLEIFHDPTIKPFKTESWWIVWVNIFGCVAFQIASSINFYTLPSGKIFAPDISTGYLTFGAVCFFVGAFLLKVEHLVDSRELASGK